MTLPPMIAEASPAIFAVLFSIAGWYTAHYVVRHAHDGSRRR